MSTRTISADKSTKTSSLDEQEVSDSRSSCEDGKEYSLPRGCHEQGLPDAVDKSDSRSALKTDDGQDRCSSSPQAAATDLVQIQREAHTLFHHFILAPDLRDYRDDLTNSAWVCQNRAFNALVDGREGQSTFLQALAQSFVRNLRELDDIFLRKAWVNARRAAVDRLVWSMRLEQVPLGEQQEHVDDMHRDWNDAEDRPTTRGRLTPADAVDMSLARLMGPGFVPCFGQYARYLRQNGATGEEDMSVSDKASVRSAPPMSCRVTISSWPRIIPTGPLKVRFREQREEDRPSLVQERRASKQAPACEERAETSFLALHHFAEKAARELRMEGKFAYRFRHRVVTAMQCLETELSTIDEEESDSESEGSEDDDFDSETSD